MSDRKVKRLTPNSIANLVMADEAWHDSLYVKAEDYDSLLADFEALRTALAAEQPKPSDSLKAMKEAFRILTKPESGYLRWQVSDACDILRTAIRTAQSALAAEQPKTPAWCMDGLAATLMREGVNKHRAREIAVGYWEAYCQIPGNEEEPT